MFPPTSCLQIKGWRSFFSAASSTRVKGHRLIVLLFCFCPSFIDPHTLGYEETVIITLATVSVLAVLAVAAFFGYRMMHGELSRRHAVTSSIHSSRLFQCRFVCLFVYPPVFSSHLINGLGPNFLLSIHASAHFVLLSNLCLSLCARRRWKARPSQPEYDGGCRLWELSGPRQSQTAGGWSAHVLFFSCHCLVSRQLVLFLICF